MFPSRFSPQERRLHVGLVLFFLGVFTAMIWPVYTLASRIRPLVLGLPFSLFYLVALLLLSFVVLLCVYLREDRRGELD